ncbi:hypothetical protein MHU86_16899 [Fragilaria crotonensis]|nr:hypothetical protein MHU86_16899 [Fragilaria crotonensis]
MPLRIAPTKWGIPNRRRPWPPTTVPPAASPLTLSSKNAPKPSTCVSIDPRSRPPRPISNLLAQRHTNRADYFSKHHPASHHQAIRSTYLYSATNPTKNYFDCLADTELPPTALALHTVDPGEGVLLYPGTPQLGNPEGHSIPMTEPRSTQISSQS